MFTCLLIKMLQILLTLGRLKTNNGNQNYNIAIGINVAKYKYVLIWCKDFSVLFGSAQLTTS